MIQINQKVLGDERRRIMAKVRRRRGNTGSPKFPSFVSSAQRSFDLSFFTFNFIYDDHPPYPIECLSPILILLSDFFRLPSFAMKSLHFLLALFIFVPMFNKNNAQVERVRQMFNNGKKTANVLLLGGTHNDQQRPRDGHGAAVKEQQNEAKSMTNRERASQTVLNSTSSSSRTNLGFGGQNEVSAEGAAEPDSVEGVRANTWRELLSGEGQRLLEQGRQLLEKLERKGTGLTEEEAEEKPNQSNGRKETEKGGKDGESMASSSSFTAAEGTTQPSAMTTSKLITTVTVTRPLTAPTTTTQDPAIKKELDNAGAPEILKLFVPPKPPPVPQEAKKIIQDKCAGGKCLVQKPEFVEQKAVVEKESEQIEQKLNPGESVEQVKQKIRVRMAKTQQLKKALVQNAGLEGQVEPADNGVFGHDQLLTEAQANELLNELARQQRPNRNKRAGNAMFVEATSTKRWDPSKSIPFIFDRSLADADKKAVREAITEIQSKTCLKFTEVQAKPVGSHLYYTKIANPTFCGLSYVGRVEPANPIYLSFMCGHPAGVAIHETMHALGFQHEQLRFDRDQFLTIQWENVNPQQLDFFTVSDVSKFSSYGIKYDYGSIMQYSSTIASSNPGKKTMVAKLKPAENDQLMGQREGLSQSDVEAVQKMYCQPGCDDKIVFCGIWATMNLCDQRMWRRAIVHAWIVGNCQKSCNKCGEKVQMVDGRPF